MIFANLWTNMAIRKQVEHVKRRLDYVGHTSYGSRPRLKAIRALHELAANGDDGWHDTVRLRQKTNCVSINSGYSGLGYWKTEGVVEQQKEQRRIDPGRPRYEWRIKPEWRLPVAKALREWDKIQRPAA